jgi:hypothetical protein
MPIYILIFLLIIILILIICSIIIQSIYNKNNASGGGLSGEQIQNFKNNLQNANIMMNEKQRELNNLDRDIMKLDNLLSTKDFTRYDDSMVYQDNESDRLKRAIYENKDIAYFKVASTLHGFHQNQLIELDTLKKMLKNHENIPNGNFIDKNGKYI